MQSEIKLLSVSEKGRTSCATCSDCVHNIDNNAVCRKIRDEIAFRQPDGMMRGFIRRLRRKQALVDPESTCIALQPVQKHRWEVELRLGWNERSSD